jgi:hypothetical protein
VYARRERASEPPEGQRGTFRPKTSNNPLDVDIVGIDLFMGIPKARLVVWVLLDQKVSHNIVAHDQSCSSPPRLHLYSECHVVIVRVNVIAWQLGSRKLSFIIRLLLWAILHPRQTTKQEKNMKLTVAASVILTSMLLVTAQEDDEETGPPAEFWAFLILFLAIVWWGIRVCRRAMDDSEENLRVEVKGEDGTMFVCGSDTLFRAVSSRSLSARPVFQQSA